MSRTFSSSFALAAALTILSGSLAFAGTVKTRDHRHPETATPAAPAPAATSAKQAAAPTKTSIASASLTASSGDVRDHRGLTTYQVNKQRLNVAIQTAYQTLQRDSKIRDEALAVYNQARTDAASHSKDPEYARLLNTASSALQIANARAANSSKLYDYAGSALMSYEYTTRQLGQNH
ncbi:MAG TPA: hypothetical protein VHN11_00975 [Xanthobacteraceae bacterium]|jgi:hypothetical protein|nr:hypothetical protein [Xanthobacteraceae bacterium]